LRIALAALAAVRDLDRDQEVVYPDFIHAMLGEAARVALEQIMNKPYVYQSDYARKYIAMGVAEGEILGEIRGEAKLLLKLLRFKGFVISPELAARVESCGDIAQLDRWAERVLTASTLDDVFDNDIVD
jgi:hypothetical protein